MLAGAIYAAKENVRYGRVGIDVPGIVVQVQNRIVVHGAAAPLQTQDSNWGTIAVDLTEFKRKGNTLTAKIKVRNIGTATARYELLYKDVYLLDTGAAKKYEVLKDDADTYIAMNSPGWKERTYGNIEPGASVNVWMKFPAPPAEVKAITLNIPEAAPFEDITITDQ